MEETKTLPTDITLNLDGTAYYDLNAEGEISGTYHGQFKFKTYLTPLEQLGASRAYRELLGPNANEASDQDRFISFALTQLKYRVLKAPPFWKTESIYDGNVADPNILTLVLDKAISAELLYRDSLKKKKEEALEKAEAALKAVKEKFNPQSEKETK